jgi:hypothetical protein
MRGILSLHACTGCGFVFNGAFQADRLDYGRTYDNTQTSSEMFASHVDQRAARVIDACGPNLKTIVEVGCGKGAFLSRLVAMTPGSTGFGFDTSYDGPSITSDGRLRFFKRYFEAGHVKEPIDALVCRHVIEHVPDPVGFLDSIQKVIGGYNTRVFFETPCVDWIVRGEVIWDFFYEHCSYFNAHSLVRAFGLARFEVPIVHEVFGGQYLWLEGCNGEASVVVTPDRGSVLRRCRAFAERYASTIHAWVTRVKVMRRAGRVAIWGAGAKGVTFAGLVDPEAELIDCVVDLNPRKQGCFIPGTGHPIVGPDELASRGVSTAVLMNPNYRRENEAILSRLGLNLELV